MPDDPVRYWRLIPEAEVPLPRCADEFEAERFLHQQAEIPPQARYTRIPEEMLFNPSPQAVFSHSDIQGHIARTGSERPQRFGQGKPPREIKDVIAWSVGQCPQLPVERGHLMDGGNGMQHSDTTFTDAKRINSSIMDQAAPFKPSESELTAPVLKAARALAGLSAQEFADLAQVGVATVKRVEGGMKVSRFTHQRLANGLIRAGIILIPDGVDGEGPGVRLARRDPST